VPTKRFIISRTSQFVVGHLSFPPHSIRANIFNPAGIEKFASGIYYLKIKDDRTIVKENSYMLMIFCPFNEAHQGVCIRFSFTLH
jgi:hypothetical protein